MSKIVLGLSCVCESYLDFIPSFFTGIPTLPALAPEEMALSTANALVAFDEDRLAACALISGFSVLSY